MKLKTAIFLSLICLISTSIFGQKTETAKPETTRPETKTVEAKPGPTNAKLPTVKEILDKYVQALGGRAANEKIKTRLIKGTLEMLPMGVKGSAESFALAPDKSYTKVTLSGIGEIIESFDGKNAWSVNPIQGNRDKTGAELLQTKMASDFYRDLNLDRLYSKMEVKGIEKAGDREVYVVVGTAPGLDAETFYFDTQSGFLLRTDSILVSPEGKMPAKTFYEDMREIDGIKLPYKIRLVLPQFEVITMVSEVKHGVTIEESLFAKPKE
jgi:zinc protease